MVYRQNGRFLRSTFVRRLRRSSMLPGSRLDETLGRATFDRKTSYLQHKLPLSPQSAPDGSRGVQMPPQVPNRVLQVAQVALQSSPRGFPFQDFSSRMPPLRVLLKDSSFRIPSGFLLQDSSSRLPPSGFLFQISFSRISPLGFFP